MGCDDAYLLSAREFGGSDTCATAIIISTALKKIGYDLVITGRQAIDGDTAQVGPSDCRKPWNSTGIICRRSRHCW